MKRTNRKRRTWNPPIIALRAISLSLFVSTLAGLTCTTTTCLAQDVGLESLKRQSLPWYDAQSEQVKPVELEAREDPRSGLRGTIAKKKQKKAKTSWNWDRSFLENVTTFLYWLLWIALVVAFAILAVWVVRNIDVKQPSAREGTESGRSLAQSVAQLPFQVEIGNDDFRSLAAKAFHANDYRQAIIWLFSHVLISLDQKNLIRLKKGKTNRQYLRELADERQLSSYYADVMVPFEATFFGDKDLNREQFASCWDGLSHFEQQVNASGETP